jgi:Protein of unknown function (DUF4031)
MSVYVDDFQAKFGRMIMCHMMADTTEELLEMADKIGVNRKWIQDKGTGREHFDVCLSARKKAVSFGAVEVGMRDLAAFAMDRSKDLPDFFARHLKKL